MIKCIICEVTRARIIAASLWLSNTPEEIAAELNNRYGANYYTDADAIYRNKPSSPNNPYRIV